MNAVTDKYPRIKMSDRLMMSVRMAGRSETVADVGCDHAHTCIWLLQNGMADRCIGMDVRKGPLEKAEENLKLYGCSDRVELRLGYGLDELKPGEAQTVIIAGMGGEMIRDILERDREAGGITFGNNDPEAVFVLQPQSHYECVRGWLYGNGYRIVDEAMCCERDKFYPCIKAVRAEEGSSEEMTPEKLMFGPVLLERKDPVLREFLDIEYRKKKYLLERIGRSRAPEALEKRELVEGEFGAIGRALKEYRGI